MQFEPRRTKKLILAFHFHRSNPAGWQCESCRREGLERRRRCGFLPGRDTAGDGSAIVWARGDVVSGECPRSAITGRSLAWLELWTLARGAQGEPEARDAEALTLLDAEWTRERTEQARRERGDERE